jgi:VCBS repeat-containing protein
MRIVKKSRKSNVARRNRQRRQVVRGLSVEHLDDRLVLSGVSPIAQNDVYSTSIDTPLTISVPGVLANDTDAESDALSASIFSSPAHGSLTLNTDGSFNYAPEAGFTGFDSFTYRANDGTSFSKLAAVTLKVFPANAQPMLDLDANNSAAPGLDFATTFTEDGGPVSIVDTDATLTDVDSANLQSLTVTISNVQDGALETLSADTAGTSIAASYAGGVLTLTGADTVAHYLQVLNSLTYQNASQNPNTTPRIITFVVNDGDHTSDVAATTLNLVSVNDAPVSVADSYTTSEDTALAITAAGVLTGDTDAEGNPLSAVLVTGPSNGALTLNADGSFNYTPSANFHGIDSFTYKTNDGTVDGNIATVTITVDSVNDLPVAGNDTYETNEDATLNIAAAGVLTGDTDGDGDPLSAALVAGPTNGTLTLNADGSFSYTPNANFNGVDSFTYTANDGSGTSAVATVNITVKPVNDVPLAANDAYDIDEDGTLTIPATGVLGNDSDLEGSALSAVLVSGPMHGSLTLNPDGSFTYTPSANYNGIDGFSYVANDGTGDSDVAAVTITVNPVNDLPTATGETYTTDEDVALTIAAPGVLAGDTDLESDPLSAVLVTGPANGAVTLNADGSFTYTPAANFNGADSFTYKANDGAGDSNVATVNITVNPVNDAPAVGNDSYTTDEDVALTIAAPGVLTGDSDVEGSPLSALLVSGPTNGTLTLNADGSFVYTPNANFNGTDGFSYKANDGTADSDVAAVTITVNAINDIPTAADDNYSTSEDTALTIATAGVLTNDSDPEGDSLTAVLVAGPANGTLTLNPDGSFLYTPNADFNGMDTFTYKNSDGTAESPVATVTITVNPVNDLPVASDDAYSTPEDTPLNITAIGVLSNDADIDGDTLTAALVSGPANGTLTLNADGSFLYTPNANFNGTDTFTYKTSDATAESNVATVTMTVTSVNDLPAASDDSYTTDEDTALTIAAAGVLTNDSDLDGNALTAALVTGPTNGTLTLNADGSFGYTPNANFNGTDTFTYKANDGTGESNVATVTITVAAVNDLPTAENDSYTVDEDNVLNVAAGGVLTNDSDVDANPLTATLVTGPMNGTLTLNGDGSFVYTPNPNFNGTDGFSYMANDGAGDSTVAAVTITVNPVNDLPTAANDDYTVDEDNVLTVATAGVLTNDADVDGNTLTSALVTGPLNGALTLNADGSFVYTPNANFNGVDGFTYVANDGTGDSTVAAVTITVNPVNDLPAVANDAYTVDEDAVLNVALPGVLANDTDADGDPLTSVLVTGPLNGTLSLAADGSFVYTPNANFNGTDGFSYMAKDGTGDSTVAAVTITVNPVNDVPLTHADNYSLDEDGVLTTTPISGVLRNDFDIEGDTLSANLVSGPTNGTLTLNGDGSYTYTPNPDFFGPDSFVYKSNDGTSDSPETTVTITVNPVNDAPVANNDVITVGDGATLSLLAVSGVLDNDTDIEGDELSAVLLYGPFHGTMTMNPNGTFDYTPNAGFAGEDTFYYQAFDGEADSNVATVTLVVAPLDLNSLPEAANDAYSVDENSVLNVPANGVMANDADLDGDPLTAALVTGPTNGSVTLNADGSFTYTPNADFKGADSFTYKVNDGADDSNVATVNITVNPLLGVPVAENDVYSTDQGVALNIAGPGVLSNDSDSDGDPLAAVLVTGPLHGTLTLNADGSFNYLPNAGFSGVDAFSYQADDGVESSDVASVTITVNPVNTAPVAKNDRFEATENTPLVIGAPGVTANDNDANGDPLTVALFTAPQHGTVALAADGSFVYTPAAGFVGTDSFTYRANDGASNSFVAAVTIDVSGAVTSEALRLAEPATPPEGGPTSVSPTQLSPLVAEAISRWLKAAPELNVAQRLGEGTALVRDLPGNQLGAVQSGQILVDSDAGGQGWFIDATPQSDEEFTGGVAGDGSLAASRIDLLTTLMHEMGHLLGLHDLDPAIGGDDLMSVELETGVRKDPAVAAVDSVFGADW